MLNSGNCFPNYSNNNLIMIVSENPLLMTGVVFILILMMPILVKFFLNIIREINKKNQKITTNTKKIIKDDLDLFFNEK